MCMWNVKNLWTYLRVIIPMWTIPFAYEFDLCISTGSIPTRSIKKCFHWFVRLIGISKHMHFRKCLKMFENILPSSFVSGLPSCQVSIFVYFFLSIIQCIRVQICIYQAWSIAMFALSSSYSSFSVFFCCCFKW